MILRISRDLLRNRWLLTAIGVSYVVGYLALPATPGNSPYAHPLGWWGWFDQGEYLKAAYALFQRDFSPDKHFYPPLYPAFGALFLSWSSGHPYFLLNLSCLLWFVYVFVRVSDYYIPRWGGVLILLGTTIFNWRIFENYLIPWTTTLSAALLASGILGLVWLRDVVARKSVGVRNWQVLFVAICLGLLVPTRPADAVVGGLLGLALLIGYVYSRQIAIGQASGSIRFLLLAIVGFIIGPAIYLGFNKVIFDSYFGNYFQIATGNGLFFADLPEKFVSLWLDGQALYGEPAAGLVEHYPWLLISLAGMVWILFKGDWFLRTMVIVTGALFVLYMPYGDLLPNGLWRYLNIHYFKWTFPFLGLFAWLLVSDVVSGWRKGSGWVMPLTVLVVLSGLLLTLQLSVRFTAVESDSDADQPIRFTLPNGQIDLIDIRGIDGGFNEIYFGQHRLWIDGHELRKVRDYRLLPVGSEVRVLFIRPVSGKIIEMMPDSQLRRHDGQIAAYVGVYEFALGLPKAFRTGGVSRVVSGYRVGDVIDFSTQGNSQFYAAEGWSAPEDWGRWSIDKEARLVMRIVGYKESRLTLEMTFGTLVAQSQPCQRVQVSANGYSLGGQNVCLESGGAIPKLFRYALPDTIISSGGLLDIRIETPDAISPERLGISEDFRTLGVGVTSVRVIE